MIATMSDLVELTKARALIDSAALSVRKAAGLSLGDIAGALNVDPSTVWRWERGERIPRNAAVAISYAQLLRDLIEGMR